MRAVINGVVAVLLMGNAASVLAGGVESVPGD